MAIDKIPSEDQVGVDSIVLFPQGSYGATEGNNIGGMRFHQGIVTRVYKVCYSDVYMPICRCVHSVTLVIDASIFDRYFFFENTTRVVGPLSNGLKEHCKFLQLSVSFWIPSI